MTFDEFLNQAWTDHSAAPKEVAARLIPQGLPLVGSAGHLSALAGLMGHLYGEHLGQWTDGITALKSLDQSSYADTETKQALKRVTASLELAGGLRNDVANLSDSDQIRVLAVASSALAGQNQIDRAQSLFSQALEKASSLSATDPANRALAVTANNLACSLEEKETRTPNETEFMILSAKASRKFWELAGTWLHVERAEYRLASTYLKAGHVNEALKHAEECLRLCNTHQAEASELKYANEILASVKAAVKT